jgi:hypothetical protein
MFGGEQAQPMIVAFLQVAEKTEAGFRTIFIA